MKYTKDTLKQYGLDYTVVYDDYGVKPEIIVKNAHDSMRYKIQLPVRVIWENKWSVEDYIDDAIDKFIIKLRKEKLIRLNEIY